MKSKRNITVCYVVNDFEKVDGELYIFENEIIEEFDDFNDIFDMLNKTEIEPNHLIVDRVIEFSKKYL